VSSSRRVLSYALHDHRGRPSLVASLDAPDNHAVRFAALAISSDGAALAVLLVHGSFGEQPNDLQPPVVIVYRPADFHRLARIEIDVHRLGSYLDGIDGAPFRFVANGTLLLGNMLLYFTSNYDHVQRRAILRPAASPATNKRITCNEKDPLGSNVHADILRCKFSSNELQPSSSGQAFSITSCSGVSIFAHQACREFATANFDLVFEYSGPDYTVLAVCGAEFPEFSSREPFCALALVQCIPRPEQAAGLFHSGLLREPENEELASSIPSSCETQAPVSPLLSRERNADLKADKSATFFTSGCPQIGWARLMNGEVSMLQAVPELEKELQLDDFPLSCVVASSGKVLLSTGRGVTFVLDPSMSPNVVARHYMSSIQGQSTQSLPTNALQFISCDTLCSPISVASIWAYARSSTDSGFGHDTCVELFPTADLCAIPTADRGHPVQIPLIGNFVSMPPAPPNKELEVCVPLSKKLSDGKRKKQKVKKRHSNRAVIV
jgi:hypothetical protein